tara:strand:- start:1149 stop:2483 length:1335 start_codon:yes stop_codon:yes gene_type:complete
MDCISPIDGRYKNITHKLSDYFSEYSFFKYRLYIEIKYFISLIYVIPELEELRDSNYIEIINDIYEKFNNNDYDTIKIYENTLKHDIKALEYFIRDKFKENNLENFISFIHFGLTSQDINTSANILSLKNAMNNIIIPNIQNIKNKIIELSNKMKYNIMLGFTHGQPAVPTTMGKELFVFAYRLKEQLNFLEQIKYTTKFGGAVGNFNAHYTAYPYVDWELFADNFITNINLQREKVTTQISNYDHLCNLFNTIKTINNIINDMNIDCWLYISKNYLKQKTISSEIGSSTMPQKVNPINFENSEGNICIANSLIEGITRKLSISRLQRDLTDSTILRNIGSILAYSLISYNSTNTGLNKIDINEKVINDELEKNINVLSEGIQTILRKYNDTNAYEKLHQLTRDKEFNKKKLDNFISSLPETMRIEISNINIYNYYGHNKVFDI